VCVRCTRLEFEGHVLTLTRQGFGNPSRRDGMYTTIVLSHSSRSPEILEVMKRLCTKALAAHEASRPGKISLYSYTKYGWHKERMLLKRPLASVILPADATEKVISDVRRFLDSETQSWYLEHGIPYKRTFLLHGTPRACHPCRHEPHHCQPSCNALQYRTHSSNVATTGPPGCGKSSLIRAVASEFELAVCMTSLADRELQDQDLRTAMCSVPQRCVVAFEDVDALFGHHRERDEGSRNVTFSGLLNALDGVSDPRGTIVFMTTNHKGKLDPALIRAGRCDVHVELSYAVDEQLAKSFSRFYKDATEAQCADFVASVRKAGGQRVTMSQLQEHFVQHRKSSIEEAIRDIRLGQTSESSHDTSSRFIYT
jgi:chaperone BCS1